MSVITEIIEAARTRGLSQRALAERAGISPAQLSRIVRGHVSPRLDTLEALAAAAGLRLTVKPDDDRYAALLEGRLFGDGD